MSSLLKVRPRSGQEIEKIANDIVQKYQPEALKQLISFDVEGFFEFELENQTGLEAINLLLPEDLDGYTDFENMQCVVSRRLVEHGENQTTKRRLRSTLAHEIGHCFLHVEDARNELNAQKIFLNDNTSSLELYKPEDIEIYKNPEWQAWRFASAMLMPENCFRTAVLNNWTKKKIKRAFDVNPSFIEIRLKELKISKALRNG